MFVNVALNIPHDKLFTYEVPANMEKEIQIGKRAFVPFGRRKRTGFVVSVTAACRLPAVKTILEILDDEPLFNESDLAFYQWIAHYFMYPLGKSLAEIIPSGAEKKDILWVTPAPVLEDISLTTMQEKLLAVLQSYPQGISVKRLCEESKLKNAAVVARGLHLLGLMRIEAKQKKQLPLRTEKLVSLVEDKIAGAKFTPKQEALIVFLRKHGPASIAQLSKEINASPAVIGTLHKKGLVNFIASEIIRRASLTSPTNRNDEGITLNKEQQLALAGITSYLDKSNFTPVLLHGVTGSGKTEVYLKAIEQVLKNGDTAIYLVPEIALTPQLISRIAGRFKEDEIAVLHSGIAESVRYDQWRQIKRGQIKLVIGARSALFAPLPNLKLIIVDEEHDTSYKQDDRLSYHARDLAVVKAKMNSAVVILGSATPSIRSFYNAQAKKYQYLELPQRVDDKPLPQVEIMDMKEQKEKTGHAPILSGALTSAIGETLSKHEQVLLFLNRRGFETFLVCADCGYNFRCPNCSVSLKSHLDQNVIKCHYCDYTQKAMPLCPSCRGGRVLSYGIGTQKLEQEIARLFPAARVQRMDSDTTSRKGAYQKILQSLEERNVDILVGTQMVTKGHDFPHITLVGVICADASLNMPDFRAAEKTFQMLTQVAGRGGRGSTPSKVIIQTFNPHHYALKHVQNHDYKSFYAEEISFRQALQYPPFGHIINVRISSIKKEALLKQAQQFGKTAKRLSQLHGNSAQIIGPSESPLAKLRGRFRWQMLVKGQDINILHQIARELLKKHATGVVRMEFDVDPESFM